MSIFDIPRMTDEESKAFIDERLENGYGHVYERAMAEILNDIVSYKGYVEDAEGYVEYPYLNGSNWYADGNPNDELESPMYVRQSWEAHFAECVSEFETAS